MNKATSFQELVDLDLYERITIVEGGNTFHYRKAGYTSAKKEVIVLSSSANVKEAIGISEHDLKYGKVFLYGAYNSKVVGEVIIEQLTKSIKSAESVYLSE
jgi:hypothetical protein